MASILFLAVSSQVNFFGRGDSVRVFSGDFFRFFRISSLRRAQFFGGNWSVWRAKISRRLPPVEVITGRLYERASSGGRPNPS